MDGGHFSFPNVDANPITIGLALVIRVVQLIKVEGGSKMVETQSNIKEKAKGFTSRTM